MTSAATAPTNPYSDRLQHLPAYGRFDPKMPDFLAAVTLDPEEAVISSVPCNHGQGHVGHLVITNRRLRWFQRLLVRTHDHWPLETTMVMRRGVPPVIELASGDLFQGRGLSARTFREFVGLHQQVVEAMRWEMENAEEGPVPVIVTNREAGLSRELDHLAAQVERGFLTATEFAAAKSRLLGLSR